MIKSNKTNANWYKYIMLIFVISLMLVSCKEKEVQAVVNTNDNGTTSKATVKETTVDTKADTSPSTTEATSETQNPTSDAYVPPETNIGEFPGGDIGVIDIEKEVVTDERIKTTLIDRTDKIFYNFLFAPDLETGVITAEDMQGFAISYIYQFEYNEFKFDVDNFILHIPEEAVTDIVKVFFNKNFTNHKQPLNEKVVYKDFEYLMPALENKDVGDMSVVEVLKVGDTLYSVIFEEIVEFKEVDAPDYQYETSFKEENGEFYILSYRRYLKVEEEDETSAPENMESDEKAESSKDEEKKSE